MTFSETLQIMSLYRLVKDLLQIQENCLKEFIYGIIL